MIDEYRVKLRSIENKQYEILEKLSNIERKVSSNTDIIVKYLGSYEEKKLLELKELMKDGNFTRNQMNMLEEIIKLFKEVLNDKEKEDTIDKI